MAFFFSNKYEKGKIIIKGILHTIERKKNVEVELL